LDVTRTRYLLGEAQLAAGDQPAAARTFAALWQQAPASYGDAAEAQLKALADGGITVPAPGPAERAVRAERLLSGGLIERALAEAQALVAEKPAPDVRERALRVVMNAARRLGRDETALAAASDALALAPPERRPTWLLELGRLRQRRDRAAPEGGAAGGGQPQRGRGEDLRAPRRRLPGRGRGRHRALAARLGGVVPR